MKALNEMELEILIAIRNNDATQSNQFYQLFGHEWPYYKEYLNVLLTRGLFGEVEVTDMPGLKKYQLTYQGNNRVGQLLTERSHAVQVKLGHLRRSKNIEFSHRTYSPFSLFSFLAHFSGRFKRQQTS
jgi:hypothetical protein